MDIKNLNNIDGIEESSELEKYLEEDQLMFCETYLREYSISKALKKVNETFRGKQGKTYIRHKVVRKYLDLRRTELCKSFVTEHDLLAQTLACLEKCQQEVPILDNKGHPTGHNTFDSKGAHSFLKLLYEHKKMFGSGEGSDRALDTFKHIQINKQDISEFKEYFDSEY